MRRSLALAAPILAAVLLVGQAGAQGPPSAPTLNGTWKSANVFVNDQVLSRSVALAGKSDGSKIEDVYVRLEDFARAMNGTAVLEPSLQLQGSTLLVVAVSQPDVVVEKRGPTPAKHIGGVKYEDSHAKQFYEWTKVSVVSPNDAAKMKVIFQPIHVGKKVDMSSAVIVHSAGLISRNVRTFDGKAVVPLADIAHAFSGEARYIRGGYQITTHK